MSSRISDPAAKLWFIKHTLDTFNRRSELYRKTPVLRELVFSYVALEALAALPLHSRSASLSLRVQSIRLLYRCRYVAVALLVGVMGFVGYQAGRWTYPVASEGMEWLIAFYTTSPLPARGGGEPRPADVGRYPDYPTSRPSPMPREIWLAEEDDQGELWSNGLRVLTAFERSTENRAFTAFPRDEGPPSIGRAEPVGIVYHTSESDIAPFRPGFNGDIIRNTRGLLRWLRRHGSYNYLIDRFGRVYRIVRDSDVAYHAGYSIWADEQNFYLNLNDSFLGICFESAWTPQGATTDIVTSAQIQAAINLTDMLRARYRIDDRNCVPHGLISVNPRKMLIGYHLDWAWGFPFPALGLADKYEVPLPSIVDFGFGYDEGLVEHLKGNLWPGIARAETELAKRAADEGLSPEVFRERLHARYRQQLELLELMKKGEDVQRATSRDSLSR